MPRKGWKLTEEQKRNMSKAQRKRYIDGRPWNYGQKWDYYVKKNISKGMKRYWQEMPEDIKKKRIEELFARTIFIKGHVGYPPNSNSKEGKLKISTPR